MVAPLEERWSSVTGVLMGVVLVGVVEMLRLGVFKFASAVFFGVGAAHADRFSVSIFHGSQPTAGAFDFFITEDDADGQSGDGQ